MILLYGELRGAAPIQIQPATTQPSKFPPYSTSTHLHKENRRGNSVLDYWSIGRDQIFAGILLGSTPCFAARATVPPSLSLTLPFLFIIAGTCPTILACGGRQGGGGGWEASLFVFHAARTLQRSRVSSEVNTTLNVVLYAIPSKNSQFF